MSTSLFTHHPRSFHENRFVYPVVSRRSRGVSVGVNLNPDKVCNFDCIYCQVDRRSEAETEFVEIDRLLAELDATLELIRTGELFSDPKFASTPSELRRLNDIAFSGDGEPTTYRNFDEIIAAVADLTIRRTLSNVKLVLITNASMFHRDAVERGLEILMANNGEIWAKLEAGTEEYFKRVDRTTIPFRRILDNITAAALRWPLVIQSLFLKINGQPPGAEEIDAFCDRLLEITSSGGQIKLIQVYTLARPPAERYVTALSNAEVDAIADKIRTRAGLEAESFYAVGSSA